MPSCFSWTFSQACDFLVTDGCWTSRPVKTGRKLESHASYIRTFTRETKISLDIPSRLSHICHWPELSYGYSQLHRTLGKQLCVWIHLLINSTTLIVSLVYVRRCSRYLGYTGKQHRSTLLQANLHSIWSLLDCNALWRQGLCPSCWAPGN